MQRTGLLADPDVADFTLLHELFQLLPGGVRVLGQLDVERAVLVLSNRPVCKAHIIRPTLCFQGGYDGAADQ